MKSEDRLIDFLKGFEIKQKRVIGNIGDDCAYISEDGNKIIAISVDSQVEGVHFKRKWFSPYYIGFRAMASALSDLAAKGAHPLLALVDLHISKSDTEEFIQGVYKGMFELSLKLGFSIGGGNISRDNRFSLSITVVGEITKKTGVPRRDGAKVGDNIYLTGDIGRSKLFLELVEKDEVPKEVFEKFATPIPKFAIMHNIMSRYNISSSIDISDGLGIDAKRLALSSRIDIYLYEDKIPLHPVIKRYGKDVFFALSSGEEYEVMFTSKDLIEKKGISLIGKVKDGNGRVFIKTQKGRTIDVGKLGFEHFKEV